MAVEARHLSLFPPQFLGNRETMNGIDGNANMYGVPVGCGGRPPLSGTTMETLVPMYVSAIADSVPTKAHHAMKADSGLTYALPLSRKRIRDSINPLLSIPNTQNINHLNSCGSFMFLGEDISLQIQQQQLEFDNFIAQHTEKVRLEIEERRNRNSRRIVAAVEEGIVKRLRAKEEEIDKIGKLNWALEEKVKSLCIENQIWRELAQTNEATANALRNNLEQVLAHVQDDAAALMDDAESCCGSNYDENGGERKVEKDNSTNNDDDDGTTSETKSNRWCRNCGKVESCVLLLPCRHLCLCTVCGSSLHTCPICKSTKNASVHVIMSS